MRIALLADIHGNFLALSAVVLDMAERGVDRVVTLGDHLSGPLLPAETAAFLAAQPWTHIAGNHERQLLAFDPTTAGPSDQYAQQFLTPDHITWLRSMEPAAWLDEGVFLCHGSPTNDTVYLLDSVDRGKVRLASAGEIEARLGAVTAAVVACAHSHVPRAVRTKSGQLVVNPGSVGLPAFEDAHPSPHVVETGSPDARYAILELRERAWTVEHVSVPYYFAPMADLADRNGRPEWASALRTGYLGYR